MLPLSPNIANAIEALFSDDDKEEVGRLLTKHCADNLPNCKDEDEYDLEDLRFRVLKLSEGNIEKLRDAVRMANEDWRDLIATASSVRKYKRELLGSALEPNVKSDAVWYTQSWNILGALVAFTSLFVLRLFDASVLQFVDAVLLIAVIYAAGLLLFNRLCGAFRGEGIATMFLAQLTFVGCPGTLGYLAARVIQSFF